MRVLVTGSAGFIGSTVSHRLLDRGDDVVGLDNYNDYYEVSLKDARGQRLLERDGYTEVRASVEDRDALEALFKAHQIDRVVHLAAQAGVRYFLSKSRCRRRLHRHCGVASPPLSPSSPAFLATWLASLSIHF